MTHPEMETSARHTLDFPMTLEYLSDELPLFAGWALRDLVRYRRRCQDGLLSTLQSFRYSAELDIWGVCTSTDNNTKKRPYYGDGLCDIFDIPKPVLPKWLYDVVLGRIQKLEETFTDPLPKPSSIREVYFTALNTHISSEKCHSCSTVHALKGERFCVGLESKLAQALDQVSASS